MRPFSTSRPNASSISGFRPMMDVSALLWSPDRITYWLICGETQVAPSSFSKLVIMRSSSVFWLLLLPQLYTWIVCRLPYDSS